MYAKVLFQRNKMGKTRNVYPGLKLNLLGREVDCRRDYFMQLFLRSRLGNDGLLRMSSINRTENTMRCDLCNERAFITCTRCKIARYCCPDHRKEDWKFHQRRCQGRTEQRSSGQESYPNGSRVNGEIVSTDSFQNDVSEQAIRVVATLRKQGYCYIDDFHGETTAKNILNEVKNLHQRQKFTDGELVSSNGNGSTLNKKIRDDKIAWVDGREKHCETISYHMNVVNSLIRKCNEFVEEYEIEHRTKQAMVACYPGQGTGYKRHVDNPSQDGRCITTLYYLNPEWTEEAISVKTNTSALQNEKAIDLLKSDQIESKKGGILKLYPGGGEKAVRILPILDRLLLFWSDRRNPHEVEPSHDIRKTRGLKDERTEHENEPQGEWPPRWKSKRRERKGRIALQIYRSLLRTLYSIFKNDNAASQQARPDCIIKSGVKQSQRVHLWC
ncbi:Egl nine-like protein 1 [Acropora cervicornis]|uniref:Egl nine-like protein 1 n=1 Tax=Acropora cervicornis TaxID=6130 RepID=A0AAD9V599_ACRCE|nr:Egl nine-like protein 1 [Acropora cervicornis]